VAKLSERIINSVALWVELILMTFLGIYWKPAFGPVHVNKQPYICWGIESWLYQYVTSNPIINTLITQGTMEALNSGTQVDSFL